MGCTRGSPSCSGEGPHRRPNGLYNFQSPHSPTEGLLVLQSEENPSLLHVGCSVVQPSPILNDSLSQQGSHGLAYPEGVVGRIKWDDTWGVIRIHRCTNRLLEPLDTSDMPILFSIFSYRWRLIKLENALHTRSHTNHCLTVSPVYLLITQNTSPKT